MENPELDILFLIHEAVTAHLKAKKPDWLADVSCDNDADSGEIIFELVDGRSWSAPLASGN